MNQVIDYLASYLSIWNVTRAAGITAYLLLFLSMMSGILYKLPANSTLFNKYLLQIHESTGWLGLLFGMTHGLVLLFEKNYTNYTIINILIPFTTKQQVLSLSLGILAFYGILTLIISTDFLKKLGKKTWKSIHFLSFPTFFLALMHGILMGSDTNNIVMILLYSITGIAILSLTIMRLWIAKYNNKTKLVKEQPPA
ncbi:ferric reductase-like transmembrane domain-containing protein [Bacillus sp. B1-b2]|uniref:ferric reductase-like transmembrane domain-containing protein n=1 Tax=Bacillus sp. B1-b2 TaxID=2653201 RepID=UPI0012619D5A|nr:ferric reductase-like transmembrane domain-containing protein [Bacillus sp. B1-b2]KAB7671817.1 ferric reductase [Bacillus sp. B1-b2]